MTGFGKRLCSRNPSVRAAAEDEIATGGPQVAEQLAREVIAETTKQQNYGNTAGPLLILGLVMFQNRIPWEIPLRIRLITLPIMLSVFLWNMARLCRELRAASLALASLGSLRALDSLLILWRPQSRRFAAASDPEVTAALIDQLEKYLDDPARLLAEFNNGRWQLLRSKVEAHYPLKPRRRQRLFASLHDITEEEGDLLATMLRVLALWPVAEQTILLRRIVETPASQPNRQFVREMAGELLSALARPAPPSQQSLVSPVQPAQETVATISRNI